MNKMKLLDYFSICGIVYGFFMFFFIFYVGKFGIAELILDPITIWHIIFNIGVWFVLVSFCMDNFFDSAERTMQRRLIKEKKK